LAQCKTRSWSQLVLIRTSPNNRKMSGKDLKEGLPKNGDSDEVTRELKELEQMTGKDLEEMLLKNGDIVEVTRQLKELEQKMEELEQKMEGTQPAGEKMEETTKDSELLGLYKSQVAELQSKKTQLRQEVLDQHLSEETGRIMEDWHKKMKAIDDRPEHPTSWFESLFGHCCVRRS